MDDSGIIATSIDYSYGTDEINEVLLDANRPRKLLITYGEEANYTILTDAELNDENSASFITVESELSRVGNCRLLK